MEERITYLKDEMKNMRVHVKELTSDLNGTKSQIDSLQAKVSRKEEERKQRFRADQLRQDDAFDEPAEMIVDEEELVLLKNLKDLKKVYREKFAKLKAQKMDYSDCEQ